MTMTANLTIHRLLDDLFADVTPTAASRDLKEELRGNLVARVDELEASGLAADAAAQRAVAELGDIRELLEDAALRDASADGERSPRLANQVRLKPAFVVRAAVVSVLLALLVIGSILGFIGVVDPFGLGRTGAWIVTLLAAAAIGWLVGDGLQQETDESYPMPRGRAIGFGLGVGAIVAAVPSILVGFLVDAPGAILVGGVLLLVGIGLCAWLGATQTNRQKPWARELELQWEGKVGSRFERDPNAAARFGIYTMLLWVVATVGAVLLGVFVGWWWAALPWLGAFIVMMLLLTQMLFKPEKHG